jgi:CRISPR-associated endonuclease/helicase Cas3
MATLTLLPHAEKLAPENPWNLRYPLLYHQLRTYQALHGHDLVVNTYNTGTGKTVASLLYLFDLNGTGRNALFIAPTNALLQQHAEDIERFVGEHSLDFKVLRVTAADVRAIESGQRPGETLQRLIRNYLEFESQATRRQPIILVVNPDIFYYALFFRYQAHDRLNVFERFLTAFDYIVVDEFHYYNSKQLANFLFAFALFDQFGYFQVRERKVCLLSATPAPQVLTYLDRLFGSRWTLISPDNEPPESADYPTTPALTSLELAIVEGEIQEWARTHRQEMAGWVTRDDLDGALISSSLWRINETYNALRRVLPEERMGRITGPEPPEAREKATSRDLILATPTVDIGYNFAKMNKQRQNVDFVVCDARFSDDLIQRIGRAGRVLGKPESNHPSRAVALLPPDAVAALASLDGQTMSRAEFAQAVTDCGQLPSRHSLYAYIRSHAITECFWPIWQMGKVMPSDLQDELDALYERVREVFAPHSRRTPGGLRGFFKRYEERERWLSETRVDRIPFDKHTARQVADWLEWLDPQTGRYDPADLEPHLHQLLADEAQRRALREFVESQVVVTRALFAFRDSFQGPTAVVYDPQHLLSSQTVNTYDLFHLISYYQLTVLSGRTQFLRECAETDLRGDFYVRLWGWREPKLSLELVYESEEEREDFQRKWCGAPVALRGLRLVARERGGDIVAGALDERIIETLAGRPLPLLIVPPEDAGAMIARLRGTDIWARPLTVRFPDGTAENGYRVLLGTAAFLAHAELQGHFLLKNRLKPEAIII